MNSQRRKAPIVGTLALLLGGGVCMGVLASSLTTDALVWQRPPQGPITDAAVATPVDQVSAGQGWARTAFDGGLRQCPKMNPDFLAACEAEMKKLAERPAFPSGSYGGPLLITKVEPVPSDDAWGAQERLEAPQPTIEEAKYEPLPTAAPEPPAFERTPDNYPAETAPQPAITIADGIAPPTGR